MFIGLHGWRWTVPKPDPDQMEQILAKNADLDKDLIPGKLY